MDTKSALKLAGGGMLCGAVYVAILAASLALCGALLWLPVHFGFNELLLGEMKRGSWLGLSALPLFPLELIAPFWIARWFYRACDRRASRSFGLAPPSDGKN